MATPHPTPALGRPAKYDWPLWTNGEEHFVLEGRDFDCTAESLTILLRRHARSRRPPMTIEVHRVTVSEGQASEEFPAGSYVQFTFNPEAESAATAQAG
jgi:hypothetical protein